MANKIIAITVALLLLVSALASCRSTKNENTTPAETTPAATTPDNPSNEITLEEIHTVGKDFLALLGEHENISLSYEYNGSVIRKDYYNKEYYHSSFSIASFGENGNYETFQTENAEYYYSNGTYLLDVTLTSDGIIDMKDYFAAVGETPFLEFNATKNENASFVQQDGLVIVTYTYDQEELAEIGGGLVSLVETYTIDITTREIISAKALSAYDDETTSDLYITIARDVEAPERAEEFLKFENATENLRTVTFVSNPGTENEKTESIQTPKGLPMDISAYWEAEGTLTLYTDAACTQIFDTDTDPNADITVYAKWEESIPEVEITLQEVYDAGKNLIALLGDHENVYARVTYEGKVIREEYLSKQYGYSYSSIDFMDLKIEYANFVTDTAAYFCSEGLYALDVVLTPDGIVETSGLLDLMGTSAFISSAVLNDETTIVEEDGFIIVSCTANLEDIVLMEGGVVSCVETYTLDAETREMVSIKTVYTYEDGTTEEGIVTITRDVEDPEGMKPFLAFAQETEDMRTVTIVSNPGTENEKTESIQVPKGLQVALGNDWGVEETFSVYEDAACTQPCEEEWDVNADITIYVKWDEIRYTVTQEEWDALVVEGNYTLERIENGETVTIQSYTDYAIELDGEIFLLIDDKIYELVEEEDGWFAYDRTYLQLSSGTVLEGCDMADFEYDEIEQAYFYKYWEDYGYTVALRFENGLPVSMTLVNIEDESDVIIRLFTDVGTTVIEIPEDYTIVEDEGNDPIIPSPVTEEMWNSYVGETNFDYGVFISGLVDSEFYSEVHVVKSTGNALVIDDVIYVLEDGKYYALEETADGWIATEATLPAFCITSLLEGLHYNDYEFYAETGFYVPKEVAENEPYAEVLFGEDCSLANLFIYNDNLSENPEAEGLKLLAMLGFSNIGSTIIEVPEYTIVETRCTVTLEEWNAVVGESNYTIERIENGETYTVQKYTDYAIEIDGTTFLFIDGTTYELVEEENGWVAYERLFLTFEPSTVLEGCEMVDFEYDENEKAYIYKYWQDYGYTIALRFENGLPVSMTLVNIEDESDVIIRLFTNVGTTVIEIPEDYTIVKEEVEEPATPFPVTEEVWNSFVGKTTFDCVVFISGLIDSEFYSEAHFVKSVGNALSIDGVIYVLEDGKYYVLEETADGWIATEATLPAYCFTSLLEGLHYNDFEFDAETGHYVPKEIVENEPYFEVWFDENGLLTGYYIYNDNLSENPETEGADLLTRIGFNNTETPVIEVPEYTIVK